MNIEQRIDKIISFHRSRFNLLLEELRNDLLELASIEDVTQIELTLGEARKIAILTECLKIQRLDVELKKGDLSRIALKYGRQPATVGIFFRTDVNLMETRGTANLRYVTKKGESLVEEYYERFGTNWINQISDIMSNKNLPDSYKFKMRLKNGGNKSVESTNK